MVAGGQIRVVLTLDDSGFSVKTKKAADVAEHLKKTFQNTSKASKAVEADVGTLSKVIEGVSGTMGRLEQTLGNFVTRLNQTAERFERVATASRKTKQVAGELKDGLTPVQRSLAQLSQETNGFRVAMESLKPSLQQAAQGHKTLQREQERTAAGAKKAAQDAVSAKIAALNAEKEKNGELVASKRKLIQELEALEAKMRADADQRRLAAAAAEKRLGPWGGKNIIAGNLADATRLTANADQVRRSVQETLRHSQALQERNRNIAQSIPLLYQQAEAEKKAAAAQAEAATQAARKAKEQAIADKEMVRAAREASAERKRLARETAEYERQQARETAAIWRSMADMWAASKVSTGLRSVVRDSAEMQNTQLRTEIMGLSPEALEEFNRKAYDLARQEKYLSNMEAIQARYTALTSLGANKVGIIDATLTDAMRTVQALKLAGFEKGSITDIQRNLYGVAEMRQVINDPEATKRTFDTVFRAAKASGGKINVADLETILRNLGPGSSQISDKGILNLLALAEQMKVAGGHGTGGAGTGVSTVGTMVKMMQLYAAGKPMKLEAIEQFVGAGLMNTDAFKGGKTERDALSNVSLKAARSAGMRNVEQLMADPLGYLKQIREPLLEYMLKNESVYFDKGADVNSVEAQNAAFTKFFARSGFSHRAVSMQVMAMDPRFMHRVDDNTKLAQEGDGAAGTIEKAKDNWSLAVMEMKAGIESLTTAFGPLLEALAPIPRFIGDIALAASEFARANPLTAALSVGAVAAGGLMLAVRGLVGGLGALGLISRTALTPTSLLASGMAGLRTSALATSLAVSSGFGRFPVIFSAVGTAVTSGLKIIGAGLLRAIPLVGAFMLAWNLAGIVLNLEVGGRKVKDWLIGWTDELGSWWELTWLKIKHFAISALTLEGVSLKGMLSWIGDTVAELVDWIKQKWAEGKAAVIDAFTFDGNFLDNAKNALFEWGSTVTDWFKLKWELVKETARNALSFSPSQTLADLEAQIKRLEAGRGQFVGPMPYVPGEEGPMPPPKNVAKNVAKEGVSAENVAPDGPPPTIGGRTGGSKPLREFENAFQRTLEQMRGDLDIARLKTGTTLSGAASYEEQAQAAFVKRWMSGDFDDGKDPSKRKFANRGYDKSRGWRSEDIDFSAADPQTKETAQGWMSVYAALQKAKDEATGVAYAQERLAATSVDLDEAARRLAEDGLFKQTDAMRSLMREFERQESDKPALANSAEYQEQKRQALLNRARADMAGFAADLSEQSRSMEASFTTDASGALIASRDRIRMEQDAFITAEKAKMAAHRTAFDERIAGLSVESEEYRKAVAERALSEEQFARYLENLERRKTEALLSPIQQLAKEWKNTTDQIEQMEANWANGFIDTLHQTITTGKGDWRSFIVGMANDISKMALKDLLAGKVTGAFDGLGAMLKGVMGGKGDDAGAAKNGFASMIEEMRASFGGMFSSLTAGMSQMFNSLSGGLGSMLQNLMTWVMQLFTTLSASGGASGGSSLFGTLLGVGLDMLMPGAGSAAGSFAASIGPAGFAAAPAALGSGLYGIPFANGGVMTAGGPLDLKAYAKGGIANSPQLALFGEGSMNEAFVPLPDGRSIPVTVRSQGGGDGGAQTVNISIVVNNSDKGGGENKGAQGDERGIWMRVADRVKGVVREELVVQQRPGGLLYR